MSNERDHSKKHYEHGIARSGRDRQSYTASALESDTERQTRTKTSKKATSGHAPVRKPCTDVKDLPPHLHQIVERMLTEGSTFEDTVQAVNKLGEERITLAAVEIYFRSNVPLQQDRIRRLMNTLHNLKEAFINPESAQADLAESVLLMGLLGLERRSTAAGVQHAIRAKDQQENVQLREDAFRLKSARSSLELKIMKARLKADQSKLQLAANKLEQLKRTLERERGGTTLSPDMVQRIHEVYGIVSDDPRASNERLRESTQGQGDRATE
jgi:hypothetical protein